LCNGGRGKKFTITSRYKRGEKKRRKKRHQPTSPTHRDQKKKKGGRLTSVMEACRCTVWGKDDREGGERGRGKRETVPSLLLLFSFLSFWEERKGEEKEPTLLLKR